MKFSHLVQINDPSEPSIEPLTRAQLWQGLVTRAERPAYFQIGVDECRILSRRKNALARELHFGSVVVRDRVIFEPLEQVRYEIEPSGDMPGGTLVMSIEEPQPDQFFVRFEYHLRVAPGPVDDFYNEFRKSAYVESDIDTIRMIRQMAASGLLQP
jgi:hypothetical protein